VILPVIAVLSGCITFLHTYHAEMFSINNVGVGDVLFFRIMDENEVWWGTFSMGGGSNGNVQYNKGWYDIYVYSREIEYIKYVKCKNKAGVGTLVLKVRNHSLDTICTITDENWKKICDMGATWKTWGSDIACKFICEEKE
jgi:hypothetical protein